MTGDEYLHGLAQRLADDGCQVFEDGLGLVGQRRDFVWPALSRLHLVTVAAVVPRVAEEDVRMFTRDVAQYATELTGAWLGWQSGIGGFSVLVSHDVTPDAISQVTRPANPELAVLIKPVVVDLQRAVVQIAEDRPVIGIALRRHLRRKRELYLPPPAQVSC